MLPIIGATNIVGLTQDLVIHSVWQNWPAEMMHVSNFVLKYSSDWRGIGAFLVLYEETMNAPHGVIIRHEYR